MNREHTFMGYRRPDGHVGIRNHVAVLAGTLCADPAAKKIAEAIPEAIYLYNPNGCAQTPDDTQRTLNILSGLVANGNIYGALIVGLGCEGISGERYLEAIREKADKPVYYIKIQELGFGAAIEEGCRLVRGLLAEAEKCQRELCDVSELILGLECGGSDPSSGFSANPVLGHVSDIIVDLGGTTVLSETPEAIGAEHILRKRGRTPEIGRQLYDAVINNEKMFLDLGMDVRSSNPSPGNIASGITTLEEKSLGCIYKSGTRPFEAVYTYGDQIKHKGLVFMDTTAYDVASTVAKIAGGAQMVVFTTGMGTPVGCAAAPVLKMTGNARTASVMADIIDFDTSSSYEGDASIEDLGEALYALVLQVCTGAPVKAENHRACAISINQLHSLC